MYTCMYVFISEERRSRTTNHMLTAVNKEILRSYQRGHSYCYQMMVESLAKTDGHSRTRTMVFDGFRGL